MRKLKDRISDLPIYMALKLILLILGISRTFRHRVLPKMIATFFRLHRKYRQTIMHNLKIARVTETPDKLIKDIYLNISMNVVNAIEYYNSSPNETRVDFLFNGHDLIQKLKEKPALYITAHIGNFEYFSSFFYHYGMKHNVIARKMDNPYIDRWLKNQREKYGHKIVYQEGSIYYIGNGFTRNENTFMLIDHRPPMKYGVWVSFFNMPAFTLLVPAYFALMQDINVVPVFCLREKGKHRIIMYGPVPTIRSFDKKFNIWANTQRYTQIIEHIIRQYPEQYLWSYKRWKSQPSKEELRLYDQNLNKFQNEDLSYKFS